MNNELLDKCTVQYSFDGKKWDDIEYSDGIDFKYFKQLFNNRLEKIEKQNE